MRPFRPFGGFTRLSRRGILVWATSYGRGTTKEFPRIAWPPRLRAFRVDRAWEGQPAAKIQERLEAGSVHGFRLDIRVYFATQHPDAKLLSDAQIELNRLRLPPD